MASNTNNKAIKFIVARFFDANGGISSSIYPFTWSLTATNTYSARSEAGYLPCGTFQLDTHFDGLGYADSTTNVFSTYSSLDCQTLQQATITPVFSSFNGGSIITINQVGFITK